jgi:hypothetical protein
VANGYLTVSLGSVTAFGTSIEWDQDLWITMNIGGTGSPSWDGEMSPRLKLTAVPYAFRASQLATASGGNNVSLQFAGSFGQPTVITLPDPVAGTATVCYQNASSCGFMTGTATDFIQNGTSVQTNANFNIRSASTGSVTGILQGANGQTADIFQVLTYNGTTNATAFNITGAGAANFRAGTNSTSSFNIEDDDGDNIFTIDTANSRIGINLGGGVTPTLNSNGLELNGALRFSGTAVDLFTTTKPIPDQVPTKINIPAYDPGAFGQILAFGLTSGAQGTSRGISVFDARSGAHQPTIAVLSPNENEIAGFSWDGSNTAFLIKNTASGSIGLNVAGTTRLSATTTGVDVTGALSTSGTITLGALDTTNTAAYLCRNSSNILAACNTTGVGAAFVQGGNSFGATAVLGTNDNFGLDIEVNNGVVANFTTTGLNVSGNISATGTGLFGASGNYGIVTLHMQSQDNFSSGLRVQKRGNASDINGAVASAAELGYHEFYGWDGSTYGRGAYAITRATEAWNGTSHGSSYSIATTRNGTTTNNEVMTLGQDGAALFRNSADSATGFRVQNAAGTATALNVDTTNTRVGIGTETPAVALHVAVNNSTINALPLRVQQSGTGDVGIEFNQPSQQFFMGIDGTDNKLKISSALAGATTGTIGNTSSAGTVDSANRNTLEATMFTAGATGTINTVYAFVGGTSIGAGANNKGQAAIYTNNAGTPGTRLGYSTADTPLTLNAWNALPISTTSVVSGTAYWLVYNTNGTADDQNNLKYIAGSANQTRWAVSQTYGTWPGTWPGTTSSSATQLSMYATILVSQNADNFATSLFRMGGTGETAFQNSVDSTVAFQLQNAAGTNLVGLDTVNSTLNLGASGTDALASTVNVGTSTGATQLVRLGSTGSGNAAAGTLINIQGGTTANTAVTIGTNAGGGITMDTGTTGTINIGTGTSNNAKTINIGPTATKTSATTIQIGVNTAGTETIHIGSAGTGNAAAGTTVNIQGGTTANTAVRIGTNGAGGITIDSGTTGNVNIGNGANAKTVTVGSTTSTSSTVIQAGTNNLIFNVAGTVRGTFDNANSLYLGNGLTAGAPNNFTIRGTNSSTTAVAGGMITIQGGAATVGNANGGNITLTGGAGFGTGVRGLVVLDTPTFNTTANDANCYTGGALVASSCTITAATLNNSAAVIVGFNQNSQTATLPDPTNVTAGRILYVTAANGSSDFTLSVNGGGTGNTIAMRQNTTATMIWNGSDWTAAGASSSTTLQSAYDSTLSSAGGAEIVLNNSATSDGLTVRNNASNPIIGAILEAQTSIGSNLFSVNNNATEYATNGGAETQGASASTFPATTWSAAPAGGTVSRNTTAANYATGQASVSVVTAATTGHGARDRLSAALTANLQYTISYTVKGAASFSTLDTVYSRDGTDTSTTACATGSTVTTAIWTRVTCTFTAPSSGITSSNEIFIRQSDATARTFYIDNLSVTVNASANHAADGSVDAALGTNWTAYDADGGAGTTNLTRDTSVIYDTSGSVADVTTANANLGMRNNMTITPTINTQYLVTFYARSSNTFNDIRVGFLPAGGSGTPVTAQLCTDYSTQSVSTTGWTKITCIITTPASGITDPDLVIYQPTATARTFYVDALSITLNTNTASNVQVGGGSDGGPATLFTLDRSAGAPIANNNDAYLGSMYYDTTSGRIQCYEADGWGACGAAPDNIVNLNPEYAGAVLNGTGIGTMTADFCANQGGVLQVNHSPSPTAPCSTSGEVKNYYRWTSPQASQQTYSVYVTYQLPATFNGFSSDDTVELTARVDSTSNAAVTYEMYKSVGGTLTQCGTGETTVTTSANTWQSVGINGNEATGCSFSSSSASGFVIFKINVKANSNANAYVSTLSFVTTGR